MKHEMEHDMGTGFAWVIRNTMVLDSVSMTA